MNNDIRLAIGFFDHPKTIRLKRAIGREGVEALLRLWCFAAQNRPEGILLDMDIDDIEMAAKWEGVPGAFIEAATADKCRWIDISDNGVYLLHDWDDHQGFVIHAPQRKAQAKKNNAKKWEADGYVPPADEFNRNSVRTQRLREAKKRGTHTDEEWTGLKKYFGNKCLCCGAPASSNELVRNRIMPIYQGGSDGLENIQPLCKTCVGAKGPSVIDYRLEFDPDLDCLDYARKHASTHINTPHNTDDTPQHASTHNIDTPQKGVSLQSGTRLIDNELGDEAQKQSQNDSSLLEKLGLNTPHNTDNTPQTPHNGEHTPPPLPSPSPLPFPKPGESKSLAETDESISPATVASPSDDLSQNGSENGAGAVPPVPGDQEEVPPEGKQPVVKQLKVEFDYGTGKFVNLAGSQYLTTWAEAYPAVDLIPEIKKAAAWLLSNPKNRKSDLPKFLNNWLKKAQDQAPPTGGKPGGGGRSAYGGTAVPRSTSPIGESAEAVRQANLATIRDFVARPKPIPPPSEISGQAQPRIAGKEQINGGHR